MPDTHLTTFSPTLPQPYLRRRLSLSLFAYDRRVPAAPSSARTILCVATRNTWRVGWRPARWRGDSGTTTSCWWQSEWANPEWTPAERPRPRLLLGLPPAPCPRHPAPARRPARRDRDRHHPQEEEEECEAWRRRLPRRHLARLRTRRRLNEDLRIPDSWITRGDRGDGSPSLGLAPS